MATRAAYRNLLRATRIAFQGDERVLTAAREQARAGFRLNADLAPSDPAVAPAIQRAVETAEFLKANVVQGKREGEGQTYKLRIHEFTERGDNDTVKVGGQKVAIGGGCCSN